jgi:signal peptidase II
MKHSILGTAAGDPASHMRLWITAGLGLAADLLSKWLAWQMLEDVAGSSHNLIEGFLSFKLVLNEGIAFGIKLGWWPILIAALAGILLVMYLFLASARQARAGHVGMGLILAGALGNLTDRVFPPYQVRDFINFHFWPTFNLADAFLCVGVGLLALSILRISPDRP